MPDDAPFPGHWRFDFTPYLVEIVDAALARTVQRIVAMKSAQIGWTDGVIVNLIGCIIDSRPCRILVLLPSGNKVKEFNDEKITPMIESTDRLAVKISLKCRDAKNRAGFKKFTGGWLKLVASNSPGDVKSSSAPLVVVEEPDDCNLNVKGQGGAIKLAEERAKAYYNKLLLIGGTPTIDGISAIAEEFERSDQRYWHVPCHQCKAAHPLVWQNVRWDKAETEIDPEYGRHLVDTAYYACPACGAVWSDAQKNRNVRRGRWVAHRPFRGVAGFHLNELLSPFAESSLAKLAGKYIKAKRKADAGEYEDLIVFWNASLGLTWAYQSKTPKEVELRDRALPYAENTVPMGGLLVTIGIDVQHDRIAYQVVAWGRGEECWIVDWDEVHGNCIDKADPVWEQLTERVQRPVRHASGAEMYIEAATIDSSDGHTNDAVYTWVRSVAKILRGCRVMAGKGRSTGDGEIYATPADRSIDPATATKASRYGLKVYLVGTGKAKDLILGGEKSGGRISLLGQGPGRVHWYRGIRDDWYAQVTESEVKAPVKGSKRRAWQRRAGRANEGLDTLVYALHAARALKTHLLTEAHWLERERALRQPDMLAAAAPASVATVAVVSEAVAAELALAELPPPRLLQKKKTVAADPPTWM